MSFAECTARSIAPAEQRLLDLLGEQPLAAGLAQRAILDAVARGADRDDLDSLLAPAMRGGQRRAHQARLRERERTAARADANRLRHGTSQWYGEAYSASLDKQMLVLGIETTCDETAAAVVRLGADGRGEILSNIVLSQNDEHAPYGGVVPEIAARAHVEVLDTIVTQAMIEANASFDDARRRRGRGRARA